MRVFDCRKVRKSWAGGKLSKTNTINSLGGNNYSSDQAHQGLPSPNTTCMNAESGGRVWGYKSLLRDVSAGSLQPPRDDGRSHTPTCDDQPKVLPPYPLQEVLPSRSSREQQGAQPQNPKLFKGLKRSISNLVSRQVHDENDPALTPNMSNLDHLEKSPLSAKLSSKRLSNLGQKSSRLLVPFEKLQSVRTPSKTPEVN